MGLSNLRVEHHGRQRAQTIEPSFQNTWILWDERTGYTIKLPFGPPRYLSRVRFLRMIFGGTFRCVLRTYRYCDNAFSRRR